MSLIQSFVSSDKYDIKCPYGMNPIGICIHNTANDAPAKNEISYMKSNNNEVSFHIAIDDVEAIQAIPFDRNAWAAGDGGSGNGNRNYIHVEICYSRSGGSKFDAAERRAAQEVAALLKSFGWSINNVKKHQDFSGKYCPHRTLDMGWQRFLNMISANLSGGSTPAPSGEMYRVRASWSDAASQKGAYSNLNNAKAECDKYPGYSVFNSKGEKVYPVPTPPPVTNNDDDIISSYGESGIASPLVTVNVRNVPSVNGNSPIATYAPGEEFIYDQVVITNAYVWISYISHSGVRRYVAVKDKKSGERLVNCR